MSPTRRCPVTPTRSQRRHGLVTEQKYEARLWMSGCRFDKEFNEVRRLLGRLDLIMLGGEDIVVEAATNYRKLRNMGVTIRGTIDVVLATRCIVSGHQLLHSDRDFDAFQKHLGLQCVGSAA